ncbi:MAG: PAS domain S-box protein [Deltaproteobacteria bacterium]|nr:MAG: PAS domain S-box protein [Deltaproteobacteria bacterium]
MARPSIEAKGLAASRSLRRLKERIEQAAAEDIHWRALADDLLEVVEDLEIHQEELRVQAEELAAAQMRAEEASVRYRELFERAPFGYCTLNDRGHILEYNYAFLELLGRALPAGLHKPFVSFIPQKDHSRFFLELSRVFQGEERSMEVRLKGAEGRYVPVIVRMTPVSAASSAVKRCRLAVIDIRDRVELEERLRDSERRHQLLAVQLEAILNGLPDAVVLLDCDLRVLYTNAHARQLLSDSDVSPSGDFCHQLFFGREQPCPDCHVLRALKQGRPQQGTLHRGDRVLDYRVLPVRDERGEIVRLLEIVRDITEKERMQAISLRNSQMASIGELAAGVAHEINNPITGILNYADILRQKLPPDGLVGEIPGRIVHEAQRIADITTSLLRYSRREAHREPLRLCEPLSASLLLLEVRLMKAGVRVENRVPEDLPLVVAESNRLQQVFINLISNAGQALEELPDQQDRKIEIRGDVPSPGLVRIVVRDNGPGIPEAIRDKIFQPFFTTKPEGIGTGLGLGICRDIVESLGGRLTCESKEGEGASFVIELPAALP